MCPARAQVWSTRSVEGVHRFLARVYRAFEAGVTDEEPTKEQMRLLHATIKKVRPAPCLASPRLARSNPLSLVDVRQRQRAADAPAGVAVQTSQRFVLHRGLQPCAMGRGELLRAAS